LPVEKRDVYLQRIAAMLNMRGHGRFTDSDLVEVYWLARRSRTTIQIMVAIISVPPRADASAQSCPIRCTPKADIRRRKRHVRFGHKRTFRQVPLPASCQQV
jgi:hypothetical protein